MRIDYNYLPLYEYVTKYDNDVKTYCKTEHFSICAVRNNDYNYRYEFDIMPHDERTYLYCERTIKSILWLVGGCKLYIDCNEELFNRLKRAYSYNGERRFDVEFMQNIYDMDFEMVLCKKELFPKENIQKIKCGGDTTGARIGFDAGGSDYKIAAVCDGKVLYSDEFPWLPKLNSDPKYHYDHICSAIEAALKVLPNAKTLGISSAGIYIDNEVKVASLFIKVGKDDFNKHIKNIFKDIAKKYNLPVVVANDGDVAAVAGAMELKQNNLLGIAMGTSEAAGFIDRDGNILGWLNELAFVPVDVNPKAMRDEWSNDIGVGVKYHSQDAIIKLADMAGIELDESLTLAQKLKYIQSLAENGNKTALDVFADAGIYFGYSVLYYHRFYGMDAVLLMGRVSSGKGGEILIENANKVLKANGSQIVIIMPDEKSRRVGQAVAAASL